MKRVERAAMLMEYLDERGNWLGRTFGAEWRVPDTVALSDGILTIRARRQDGNGERVRFVTPSPGLLDSFLSLADASNQVRRLSGMMSGSAPSDEKIFRFAKRYGGLEIFYEITGRSQKTETEHIEYCSIWDYFASAMRSLLQIGAELYRGRSGLKEDWQTISAVPSIMHTIAQA